MILLDAKEREKFALYLKQQAEVDEGMAEQFEKLKMHKAVVKRYRMKMVASILIADDLLRIEDMEL